METDDDMIVVIVGDGEDEEFPASVKQEVLDDDDVEQLIETAATHGEFVDVFPKEEPEEYEDNGEELGLDGDYIPEDDDDEDDEDDDDESGNEALNKHRHNMLKPSQQKSFVKELRDRYPELEDDSNALVITLSEIMRNVKPPPPPQDYFIMNGIMFECVHCGTISETQPAAGRHYQDKHGERYLVCFACGVDFRSTTNLYKHEKRCMAPDAVVVLKARACALGRKGRSRPYLPKHFPTDKHLKKSGNRRFMCAECPASFVSQTYLRSHELLHRGVRPYKCPTCPSSYTSLAALSRHRKKHSDDQYICDHCGRAFKIKAALVTHMDTHLPVKKFGCEQCEKRYATKAAMLRHVKRKHLNLPPPCVCKICFKRYPLMSVLKEHTKKAHGLMLMTRRMFFKSLPTLTNTQIEHAKIVLKSEVEPKYSDTLMAPRETSWDVPVELPIERSTVDGTADQSPDQSAEVLSPLMQKECKGEPTDQDDEQTIFLSEDILQYVQSVQGDIKHGENYNVVLVQDGETINLNYEEVPHELLSNGELVLLNGEYIMQSET